MVNLERNTQSVNLPWIVWQLTVCLGPIRPHEQHAIVDGVLLAGAMNFSLAGPESADNRPVFAQLMLDEAFSKSDPQFALRYEMQESHYGDTGIVVIGT